MKTVQFSRLGSLAGALAFVMSLGGLSAQTTFDSGSNGSLGDVVITNDTQIPLPPDGILHYRSFKLTDNKTVTFIRNANNTPVYLLSQGDVVIEGTIDIGGGWGGATGPGIGGPGGFDGGRRANGSQPPGDGNGPGAGKAGSQDSGAPTGAGSAGFGSAGGGGSSTNHGAVYGNPALIPLIGGSGGGGNSAAGGGGGAGAILVASNTKIEFGTGSAGRPNGFIYARGGQYSGGSYNSGSGGGIKMVAPWITGVTRLHVYSFGAPGGSSIGRIRLDATRYDGLDLGDINPSFAISYGSMMATGLEGGRPQLSVVSFADKQTGTNVLAPLNVILPNGSDSNQPVTIRAENFGTVVPVAVVLTPDNGPRTVIPTEIDNRTQNPATRTLSVPVPANTPVQVRVWTR
jgi:hypothetical protein